MTRIFAYIKAMRMFLCLFIFFLQAVPGFAKDKVFTIGVVNCVSILSGAMDGFKSGMTELGHIEGKNVKYIDDGLLQNDQKIIETEIRKLISMDVDMLLSVGYETSLEAKKLVEGTEIPVLTCFFRAPVESGLIKSFTHPGGNITGVAGADRSAKALEWLKTIIPGVKNIFIPYNPNDRISGFSISELEKTASQIGIEIDLRKVHSVEEAVAAINSLPKTVQAVFMIPSPTLNLRSRELCEAAISKGLITGASIVLDEAVMATFSDDAYGVGKQTARLAHQVMLGIKPGDIPFERSEVYLTINLKIAERIGLNIPDSVLLQAKTIIR